MVTPKCHVKGSRVLATHPHPEIRKVPPPGAGLAPQKRSTLFNLVVFPLFEVHCASLQFGALFSMGFD